jgi:hypothetical protein
VAEPPLECATAPPVRPVEPIAGDLAVVAPAPADALIARADRFGSAAVRATWVPMREAWIIPEANGAVIMRRCHGALRSTRGADPLSLLARYLREGP